MNKNNKWRIILVSFIGVLLFVADLALFSALWYKSLYGDVGFTAILFTLTADGGGTEKSLLISYFFKALIPALLTFIFLMMLLWHTPKKGIYITLQKKQKSYKITPFPAFVSLILSVAIILSFSAVAAVNVSLPQYIVSTFSETSFYEDEYVNPNDVNITFPDNKRNVIIIYLESMETSFLSEEQGGGLPYNVIPELYDLASENINFSHNQDVGGWPVVTNTTWTVAALVSQTSGIPLTVPVKQNKYGKKSPFLPGLTTMQDILAEEGYYQTVMFGSEGNYAGRDQYYYQHRANHVYDLFTARKDGIIPGDYYVWWGMEDMYLYKYAKQELTKIAEMGQPFAFSMLTVDTHHVGGYKCDLCDNLYDEQYENVYSCASKQLNEFVNWIKEQDFYENTTIVICGDHASMDADYFKRNFEEGYDRHMYNCIINSAVQTDNTKNRVFTPMDMFPTVLASMGCKIEGDRLGLGTNLFSDKQTLAEKYTLEFLNEELGKSSEFYTQNFITPTATETETVMEE